MSYSQLHPTKIPDLLPFILSRFPVGHKGKYLHFGEAMLEVSAGLAWKEWQGVDVLEKPRLQPGSRVIVGQITKDPRIVKVMDGHWVRTLTVGEIFTQFPGPYDVIGMVNTDMDRTLWENESIFNALPKVYVLGEDGNNGETIKTAVDRGYNCYLAEDKLVLVHL